MATSTETIHSLEQHQVWLWRFGWLWMAVAFWFFMTQVEPGPTALSIAAIVATIGPLCFGGVYSFLIIGERIHRLEMARLLPAPAE